MITPPTPLNSDQKRRTRNRRAWFIGVLTMLVILGVQVLDRLL